MAFGLEIYNLIPNEGYMLVHLIEILFGLYLAKMAMEGKHSGWMWLFLFYAINGHMTGAMYHEGVGLRRRTAAEMTVASAVWS